MKKIVSVLSIITLIIILTVTPSYANDADVILTTSSETVKPGDTITLTVTINETQDGIAGLQGKVQWNTEQLTYISSQVGSDFTTLNFNDDITSDALGTFTAYGDNYITTGANVFTVTFEVNSELTAETQIDINITGIKAVYQTAGKVDIQDKIVNLSVANNILDEEPIPEENTNTRFYFDDDNLKYIKTTAGDKSEIISVNISYDVDDSVFDIPSDFQEG